MLIRSSAPLRDDAASRRCRDDRVRPESPASGGRPRAGAVPPRAVRPILPPAAAAGNGTHGHCYVVVAPAVQGVAHQDPGAVQRPRARRPAGTTAAISSADSA